MMGHHGPSGAEYVAAALVVLVPLAAVLARHLWRSLCTHRRAAVVPGLPVAPCKAYFLVGHAPHFAPDVIAGSRALCVDGADPDTGLCSFWFTVSPAVSVLRAEHARRVFAATTHRDAIKLVEVHMDQFLGRKALVTLQHEEWALHRRLISSAFKYSHLKGMVSDISDVAQRLCETLRNGVHGDLAAAAGLDLVPILKKATLDVIGRTSFDHDFACCQSSDSPEMAENFKFLLSENARRSHESPLNPASFLYWLPTRANRRFRECKQKVHGLLRGLIGEHRRKIERAAASGDSSGLHQNFMTLMLLARDGERSITDEALIDNMMVLFFGGYDTTSIGLAYACYELARHPAVARKVRSEVAEVMGERLDFTYEDYTRLSFTTAVWKETLRLYPPAPITARNLLGDMELEGVIIPAGTMMYIPIWWIHRDPRNWGPDAAEFVPGRFLEAADGGKKKEDRAFANYFAFSGGARVCVGHRFALLEGVVVLAQLARSFDFARPDGAPEVVSQSLGVVQEAKHGVWLKLGAAQ